ncbi:MAG TPA: hypothetical protein VGJ94_12395 [Syntrophorhabdaceae bacterium]|jgi:hypothetical protein
MKKTVCVLSALIMFSLVFGTLTQAAAPQEGKMFAELSMDKTPLVKDSGSISGPNSIPGLTPVYAPGYAYNSAYNPGYYPY